MQKGEEIGESSLVVLEYHRRSKARRRRHGPNKLLAIGLAALGLMFALNQSVKRKPQAITAVHASPATAPAIETDFERLEKLCCNYRRSLFSPVYINAGDSADSLLSADASFVRFEAAANGPRDGWMPVEDQIFRPVHPWSQFRRLAYQSPPDVKDDSALLFLHERRAKGTTPRLVAVELNLDRKFGRSLWIMVVEPHCFDPMKWKCVIYKEFDTPILRLCNRGTQFYEGEPDDKDASHFTIKANYAGAEGVIDGNLLADDHVKLVLRDERVFREKLMKIYQGHEDHLLSFFPATHLSNSDPALETR